MTPHAIAALHEAAAHAHEDRHKATVAAAWARHLTAHPPATEAHTARLTAFCASLSGYADDTPGGVKKSLGTRQGDRRGQPASTTSRPRLISREARHGQAIDTDT
jgi:hypothetical protein